MVVMKDIEWVVDWVAMMVPSQVALKVDVLACHEAALTVLSKANKMVDLMVEILVVYLVE
jgi:hypothetical protein